MLSWVFWGTAGHQAAGFTFRWWQLWLHIQTCVLKSCRASSICVLAACTPWLGKGRGGCGSWQLVPDQLIFSIGDCTLKYWKQVFIWLYVVKLLWEAPTGIIHFSTQGLKSVKCNGSIILGVNKDQVPTNLAWINLEDKSGTDIFFFFFLNSDLDGHWQIIPCI